MVGARCAVASCGNSYTLAKKRGHVLSLHSFPKDPDLREAWIEACSRGDAWNPDTSFVCSDHFALDDFISDQRLQLWTGVKWRPQLKPGAIPTRNLTGRRSKYKMGRNDPKEPHQRFSMFQVVSLELQSRQEKMHKDIHKPPADNAEPNVGSTESVETSQTHTASRTGQTMNSNDSNQGDTRDSLAPDTNHDRAAERITLDFRNTDSNAENDESSLSGFHHKKPRINMNQHIHTNKSLSIKRGTTGWRNSSPKQVNNGENYDFNAKESQLSPVKSKVIYSCPGFELFVDDGD